MDLEELTAYAEKKHQIGPQQRRKLSLGVTALVHPASGKWVAVLMRAWDELQGEEIQLCDLKCGHGEVRRGTEPWLTAPHRMKGPDWVGVRFGRETERETVFRLFDEAMSAVASVKQMTTSEFETVREKALELGRTTKFTAEETANARRFIRLGEGILLHDGNGFSVRGVDVDGDPFEMVKPVPSLYSCHIEYDYLGKHGDCVDLNTLTDTWYVYPRGRDFSVTKMALATEELYFDYRRKIGKPCPPGLA